jgi:hypothetical protein
LKVRPTSIKELCELIWYWEDKYSLLDFEIDGVKVWQFCRMNIYYDLAKKLNILTEPHRKLSRLDKLRHLFKYFVNAIFHSPFYAKKVSTIIFPHQRLKKVDGEYIDIYTHYFKSTLEKSSYIEISEPYIGTHFKHSSNEYFGDIFILGRNLAKRLYPRSNSLPHKLLVQFEEDIHKSIGMEYQLEDIFIWHIKRFKIEYFLYKKLFKKLKPQNIYLTVSYGKGSLIKAAKDLDIQVHEFQHGTYSRYHMGYSFPNRVNSLDYFPDKFYVWNGFWKNLMPLPIENKDIINYGFQYMEQIKQNFRYDQREKKQVVILSQGAITDKIAEETLKYMDVLGNYTIKYKLHPGEYGRWKEKSVFKKLMLYKNIEIVEETDLYALFSCSQYVIGVFSTAIYEAIEFDCEIRLYNLTGVEYMEDLLNTKRAKLFNGEDKW